MILVRLCIKFPNLFHFWNSLHMMTNKWIQLHLHINMQFKIISQTSSVLLSFVLSLLDEGSDVKQRHNKLNLYFISEKNFVTVQPKMINWTLIDYCSQSNVVHLLWIPVFLIMMAATAISTHATMRDAIVIQMKTGTSTVVIESSVIIMRKVLFKYSWMCKLVCMLSSI